MNHLLRNSCHLQKAEMPSTIRHANAEDLNLLLRWGQALHEVEQQFEPQLVFSVDEARVRYQHELHNLQAVFLIAEDSGQPVGYLYAHIDPTPPYFALTAHECIVEAIYLEVGARGKGFADLLIQHCMSWANDRQIWRLSVGIYAMNHASHHIFQRCGFRPYHSTLIRYVE